MDAITIETVRLWAKELSKLKDEEQARQQRIAELQGKLVAAATLGLVVQERPVQTESDDDGLEGDEPGLPALITMLLRRTGGGLRPPEIRKRLIDSGLDAKRFGTNNSYFYTTLGRLVKRGILKKRGKNYSIAA